MKKESVNKGRFGCAGTHSSRCEMMPFPTKKYIFEIYPIEPPPLLPRIGRVPVISLRCDVIANKNVYPKSIWSSRPQRSRSLHCEMTSLSTSIPAIPMSALAALCAYQGLDSRRARRAVGGSDHVLAASTRAREWLVVRLARARGRAGSGGAWGAWRGPVGRADAPRRRPNTPEAAPGGGGGGGGRTGGGRRSRGRESSWSAAGRLAAQYARKRPRGSSSSTSSSTTSGGQPARASGSRGHWPQLRRRRRSPRAGRHRL